MTWMQIRKKIKIILAAEISLLLPPPHKSVNCENGTKKQHTKCINDTIFGAETIDKLTITSIFTLHASASWIKTCAINAKAKKVLSF